MIASNLSKDTIKSPLKLRFVRKYRLSCDFIVLT